MEDFLFITECLLKLNYPNIHGMDEPKIAAIFSDLNRNFLVSWFFKQIDNSYGAIVENATNDDLAELLHCNGFCPNSLKKQFMNGECEKFIQFEVLCKMFLFLNDFSNKEDFKEMNDFTNEELQDLLNSKRNLFPMYYRTHKILTLNDRKAKIEQYRKEIEHLGNMIQAASSDETKPLLQLDDNLHNKLSFGDENFESILPDFKRKVFAIMRDKQLDQNENIFFKENLAETFNTCHENAKLILNFIQNVHLIMHLKGNTRLDVKDFNGNNSNGFILRELHGLCKDVISASK